MEKTYQVIQFRGGFQGFAVCACRSGEQIRACEQAGIDAYPPKPNTSGNRAKGQFDRSEFHYKADDDQYECPAGERLIYRFTQTDKDKEIRRYWSSACTSCPIKAKCTTGKHRRIGRWVHEAVVERAQTRLDSQPEVMRVRRATVEHPFGTIKSWMGSTHFSMKTFPNVSTEMNLHVLAYKLKRFINLIGTRNLIAAIEA